MKKFSITVNGVNYEVDVEEIKDGVPAAPAAPRPQAAAPAAAPAAPKAMKMENEIPAPCDGVVASLHVAEGAAVNGGDLLVSLK